MRRADKVAELADWLLAQGAERVSVSALEHVFSARNALYESLEAAIGTLASGAPSLAVLPEGALVRARWRRLSASMRLVSTPDNVAPPGAVVAMARAVDGVRLRTARWVPQTASRGTVVLLQGRAEYIEKYYETIAQLLARGFAVAAMDWRGQAGSARLLKNPRKGHVDDFSLYERDLGALADDVLGPSCPQPWFGLCHSMGAAIMLSSPMPAAVRSSGSC